MFHSFRSNFRIALTAATEDSEVRNRMMGHAAEGTGAKHYNRTPLKLHESEVIDRVKFAVDLSYLR